MALLDIQAASHPFQVTNTLVLNQKLGSGARGNILAESAGLPKDLNVRLPTGMVGNPTSFVRCALGQFLHFVKEMNECTAQTAVGVATVLVSEPDIGMLRFVVPVFNLEPGFGEPARFGFYVPITQTPVILDTSGCAAATAKTTVSPSRAVTPRRLLLCCPLK